MGAVLALSRSIWGAETSSNCKCFKWQMKCCRGKSRPESEKDGLPLTKLHYAIVIGVVQDPGPR